MPKIDLYPIPRSPRVRIEPGKKARDWMSPHSYRCLPIVAANAFGWDIILTEDVSWNWNGGSTPEDLKVETGQSAKSHFGMGTVTFTVGYSWRTEPGVHLMVGPVPNPDMTLFHTISAVIETDTLQYPWFLSVRSLRKGDVYIPAGTVLGRVFPVRLSDVTGAVIAEVPEPEDYRTAREATGLKRTETSKEDPKAWLRFYHDAVNHPTIRAPQVEHMAQEDMLVNNGILAIPEFLTEEECRIVAAAIEGEAPERAQSLDYWKGKTFDFDATTFPPEIYEKLTNGVREAVRQFYGAEKMEMEHPHLVRWRKGDSMRPHSDHAQGKFPWRDYAVLVYLTDDYTGGELYLPTLDLELAPQAGALVAFPGGKLFHGVKEVTSGVRKTCITWLHTVAEPEKLTMMKNHRQNVADTVARLREGGES